MRTTGLAVICIAVLCITLTLGLWPFHAPHNAVSWLAHRNGLRFGRNGTIFSSNALQNTPQGAGDSLELWLQPGYIWDSNTFLAFYSPPALGRLSLRQQQTDLLITTAPDDRDRAKNRLYVADAFHKSRPVFITITSGAQGTLVYLDGVAAKAAPSFLISPKAFSGRLFLGDSPRQTDGWFGQLLGCAIYRRELTQQQTLYHYLTWKQKGRPEVSSDEHMAALYLFDERAGNVAHDKTGSGVDLDIPAKYTVIDQIFLEPFWTEFGMTRSYWSAVVKNIIGFMPFGFCFYAYLATVLSLKRATLVTVALGTAVSFTIEILQAYLPTRDSGTSDLITNTLGAWIGAAAYGSLATALTRAFPWLPFPAPPHR